MIAISESTPGAIGINMSTYAGFLTAGVPGGIIATLGLGTPCVIIILIIARILKKFKDNPYVEKAFYGLRAASIAMISAAGINVARIALVDLPAFQETGSILRLFVWKAILLALILYFAMKKVKLHPIAFIAISALVGILFHFGGV
jgi:chromate transporter